MFNLLRMDLYRLKRSKSVYVCLGFLLLMTFLTYWMVWLIVTPQGREAAIGMGFLEINADPPLQLDTLSMYRDAGMDGGAYSTILGIVIALFICMDFGSGFMKNIMSLHRERWKYIGSKIMTAGILNFFYIILQYGFSLLLNLYFGNFASATAFTDLLFYLSNAWLLNTAFAALVILICVLARNTASGVLAAIALGSGMIVLAFSHFTGLFGMSGWMEYTLYCLLSYGPSSYTGIWDLKETALGLAFLAAYSFLAMVSLARRDV